MNDPVQDEFALNSQLQQQQINAHTSYNAPYLAQAQREIQAVMIEQLDPIKVIIDLELLLAGKCYNASTGEIEQKFVPIMNDYGIGRITIPLRSLVTLNTAGSAFESKEIGKLMIRLDEDVIDLLTLNWKEFGLKDKSFNDMIVDMVLFAAFSVLKRAYMGGERKFWGTTTIENIAQQPKFAPPKKEGFWSRFKL